MKWILGYEAGFFYAEVLCGTCGDDPGLFMHLYVSPDTV